MKTILPLLFVCVTCSLALAQPRPDLIEQALAGQLPEAKASWWGFNENDSTEFLQAGLYSGVKRLVVDNVGKPWIVRPLFAESNQIVIFEKGVVIEAKKGEFKGKTDSLLSVILKENVTLKGNGAILRMHRTDYLEPKLYEKAQWRHALSIRSSKNVNVSGLTLTQSGGDGIYLGVSKRGVTNENITIKDVICDRNYRQGISVISARNLLIENVVMKNTSGTAPSAGIDFEPNNSSEELVNCVMRNCIAESNFGSGYAFCLNHLNINSIPVSIRLENCIARGGNNIDFSFKTKSDKTKVVGGKIEIMGCRFEKARSMGIFIRSKPVDGVALVFRDCVINNPGVKKATFSPITIRSHAHNRRSVGGVDFGRLVVIDPLARPVLAYQHVFGGTSIASLTGTLVVQRGEKENTIVLTKEWLKKAFPYHTYKHIPFFDLAGKSFVPVVENSELPISKVEYYVRKKGTFVLYAQQDETVVLRVKHGRVSKYGGQAMKILVVTPSGRKLWLGDVAFKYQKNVSFTASETGVYRLPLKCGANRMAITGISHPILVSSESEAVHFIRPAGDFYFLVPKGTKHFGVLVYGQGENEAVKATIFDPSNKKVWEKDNITLPEMFESEQVVPTKDQVWRLQLSKPNVITCEDYNVDLLGVPPFFARDPQALLIIGK